ncbi:MAG TPA: transporter substrate-binding domain-containing protein [Pseudorhodoferax sp.]|nr:transporter substrate-binding domain-containing protein [Pseudorhodoferax sp.]
MNKLLSALLSTTLAALTAFAAAPAQAEALDAIKARGEMVIGMEVAYRPFEYFQNGETVGFDVDILKSMAEALGVKLKTVDTAWAGILPALLERKFDAVLSGMTITADRQKKVNFTQPVAIGSVVFLVRSNDDKIKRAEDVSGRVVATQLGSIGDRVAKQYEAKLVAAGKKGFSSFKLYDAFPEAYLELSNGRIDAVSGALPVLQAVVSERPGRFRIVDGIQDVEAYLGMAIRKEDQALLQFANAHITELKRSGKLEQLQIKWFGAKQAVPDTVPALAQ